MIVTVSSILIGLALLFAVISLLPPVPSYLLNVAVLLVCIALLVTRVGQ